MSIEIKKECDLLLCSSAIVFSGAEQRMVQLAELANQKKLKVVAIVSDSSGVDGLVSQLELRDVSVVRFSNYPSSFLFYWIKVFLKFRKVFFKVAPKQIVFILQSPYRNFLGIFAAVCLKIPYKIDFQLIPARTFFSFRRFFLKNILQIFVSKAVSVVAVSFSNKKNLQEILDVETEVEVVGNFPLSANDFLNSSSSNQKNLLVVSRDSRQKNLKTFIYIIAPILKSRELKLFFVGEMSFISQHLVWMLGIAKNVEICGRVKSSLTYLREAQIFLHAALYEGSPLAIIEAMSAGVVVVAFDVDGVTDLIVNDQNGILVPFGNIVKYREAVCSLLDNDLLRKRLAEQARIDVKKYLKSAQESFNQSYFASID